MFRFEKKIANTKQHQKERDLVFCHNAAGEGDRAALHTGVQFAAVEVHVVGPVGERNSTTAAKLWEQRTIPGESAVSYLLRQAWVKDGIGSNLYLSLPKVNQVLQINVIPVVGNGVVNDFSHFISSLDRSEDKDNLKI